MNKKTIFIQCCLLASVLLLSCSTEQPGIPGGNSSVDKVLQSTATGKTLVSPDGACQATVPDNWTAETTLNKDAKIQASMRMRDAYLVVFVDQKDKYGQIELDEFAEGAHKKLTKRLTSPVGNSGTKLTVGGLPAIQYELTGQSGGANFTYIQTLVQGATNFYEILMWTPKTQLDKNKYVFQEILKSFKEGTAK